MASPQDLSERRSRLTPAQRELLEKRLRSAGQAPPEDDAAAAIAPRPGRGPAPLSYAQARLWGFAERHPASPAYNVYHGVGLRGPLDVAALAAGVRAVVERHEVFRTRFVRSPEGIMAVAEPDLVPAALPLIDLSGLPAAPAREAEGLRTVLELAAPCFDLENGPPLRRALLRLGGAEHVLIVAVHHIVIDGWTLALFVRELAGAYEALSAGHAPSPAAPPLQYADFAGWQRRRAEEGTLAADLAWWKRHLAGAPREGLAWPPRPRGPAGRSMLMLGAGVSDALRALAQRERVTPFIILLAGLKAVLYRQTGQEDLIVGTPVALRDRPEAAGIAGMLLNLLALRTGLSGDPSFLDLLHRVRDTCLGAFAHREAPLEWLAGKLLPDGGTGATPWIRVLFNMPSGEAGHSDPLKAGGLEVQPLLTGEMGAEFDLTFYARELAAGIRLDLGFNAGLLAPGESGRLLEGFAALLAEVAAHPERRLSEIDGVLLAPAGLEA